MGATYFNIRNLPGKQRKLQFITPYDTVDFMAVDSAKLNDKNMNDYVGECYSDESESTIYIILKDGKLIAHRNPKTDYPLTPSYRDGFNSPAGTIYFERNKKSQISGMKIFVGRARNVEFKKISH